MQRSVDRPDRSMWKDFFRRKRVAASTSAGCPHMLGQHLIRTARSTQAYPDGGLRLPEHRGGRLVVDQTPCVWAPGHTGVHKTFDGRSWS